MKNIFVGLLVAVLLICGFYHFTGESNASSSFIIEKINNCPYNIDRDNAEKVLPPEKRFKIYKYRVIVQDMLNYKKYLKMYPDDSVIELGNRPDAIASHVYTNDLERIINFLKKE